MGIVDDLLSMQRKMASDRQHFEGQWRDVAELAAPYAAQSFESFGTVRGELTGSYQVHGSAAANRSRTRYDSTAAWSVDRLAAGMESLTIPRSQKWHGMQVDDPFAPDRTPDEEEWLDRLRDYLFVARYDARANFALAAQKAVRSVCAFGTGILYNEENMGRRGTDPRSAPFFYRHVPVSDIYLGIDAYDDVDKAMRVVEMSARAASDYFGEDKLSAKTKAMAGDPRQQEEPVTFMQAVIPRDESGEFENKRTDQPFASFWFEVESRHLISNSGFFTFPFHVMWWDQSEASPYGQSAVMAMLSDIKMLQHMRKTALQSMQQYVRPAYGSMEGVYAKQVNWNAGKINPGLIDNQGRQKVQALNQGGDPGVTDNMIEKERANVREGLYVNLFQTLVDNPQMTATEALIRSNEKGELLGPAGAKMESGVAQGIDREIDIVGRKGAFEEGSALEPPESILGSNVNVKHTGPLARLRRTQELQGVQTVLEMANALVPYDESLVDRIDSEDTLETVREISGAPRKMFRTDEEVAEIRQGKAQVAEQAAAMQLMQNTAQAAGQAAPALQLMQEAS